MLSFQERNKVKAAFYTLGCKVNSYDTELMIEAFRDAGYEIVDFTDKADLYVINTCTVTHLGDRKSRQISRRAKRLNPEATVVATGCYAQVDPDALDKIPEIDLVVGTKDKHNLLALLENNTTGVVSSDFSKKEIYPTGGITEDLDHTRAFVKIQDGCNQYCSYCIVPYARGPIRSRDEKEVLEEVRRLVEKGYKEVVLTGIHIASFGLEKNKRSALTELIKKLPETGLKRLRLSSLEPRLISREFLETLKKTGIFMESFHLSLQSGSATVLKRMNRHYTPEEYFEKLNLIREYFPNAGISTDVIVGFPGETEEEFRETLDFVAKCQFSSLHIFPYSARRGTPASEFENQIDSQTKKSRAKRLENLKTLLVDRFYRKNTNAVTEVLVERKIADHLYSGYSRNYIPVEINSDEDLKNKIVKVKLKPEDNNMRGEIIG